MFRTQRGRNDDRYFATMHEYALFTPKTHNSQKIKKFEFSDESLLKQFHFKILYPSTAWCLLCVLGIIMTGIHDQIFFILSTGTAKNYLLRKAKEA